MDKYLCGVVNTLLNKCRQYGVVATPLYLQKLLYFYYVEYLHFSSGPVENIQFEAWKLGPVNRELYYAVKEYGRSIIANNIPYVMDGVIYKLKDEVIAKHSVRKYGAYTATELIAKSHIEGGAWSWTRKNKSINYIPQERIKNDYPKYQ